MDEPNELDPLFVSDVGLHERFSGHVCCTRHPGICCTSCRGQEMPRFISRGSATPVNDYKERRMNFAEPSKLNRNPEVWSPGDLSHFSENAH